MWKLQPFNEVHMKVNKVFYLAVCLFQVISETAESILIGPLEYHALFILKTLFSLWLFLASCLVF